MSLSRLCLALLTAGVLNTASLELCAATNESEHAIHIPDPELRRAFESVLEKEEGEEITRTEMERVHELTAYGVAQLSGIEHAVNLWELELLDGRISDLDPLSGLLSLVRLNLYDNQISDLTPIANLPLLRDLVLDENPHITDYTALANLRLESLWLGNNGIQKRIELESLTSLLTLDLSGNPAMTDLTGLPAQLTTLYLGRNSISDLANLNGVGRLTSLATLGLYDNRISDVTLLLPLKSLRRLDLEENGIVDLNRIKGLAEMDDVQHLDLSNNNIVDWSPLSALESLSSLAIGETGTSDLAWLSGFPDIRALELGANGITSLTPLANLSELEWIYVTFNYISDLSPLSALGSLHTIYAVDNYISDLSPLLSAGGLSTLAVGRNPLSNKTLDTVIPSLVARGVYVEFDDTRTADGADVAEFVDPSFRSVVADLLYKDDQRISIDEVSVLTRLYAARKEVSALGGIELMQNLRHLDLRGNKLTDILPLSDVGTLRYVFLGGNDITDVGPLERLSLYSLSLDGNLVDDLTPLVDLPLSWLAIDRNAIEILPRFKCCLQYLYMRGNSVADVSTLDNQVSMIELDLSGNKVTSLLPLTRMQGLVSLHVNDNDVSDLAPLPVASLEEIYIRNNNVGDLSPLLGGERLLIVDVRRNPLADDALGVIETLRERRVTVLAGEAVPYFPAAGDGRQGFVRIINRSDEAGHVFIEAVDDAGVRAGPVRMEIGAGRAVHFNSGDLERGNATKGLRGGIGGPTAGDWRLSVISALDVEVLSYIRTEDGFVTAMHDVAADGMAPFFNPGSNDRQRSILRVVNTEAEPAKWTTGGYDDHGRWHPMAGSLLVRPQRALTLTARALEDDHGLGDGHGKWRLRTRGFPWYAMSLLESPTGHLTNLSTAPDNATELADGRALHRLPLFPAAGGSREGFVRVINRSYSSGEVVIEAVDDAGVRSGPVRLTLRPRRAAHFNSMDLEVGNTDKGLDGGVGVGQGDWRLEVTSELDLMVLSYARTGDGFLTSLHDLAPVAEDGGHRVVFFNPSRNTRQVSKLRLINDGERAASATVTGIDDHGNASGPVAVTVPAGAALTFTASELEAGEDDRLAGGLGNPAGRWRLRVRSDEPIAVMSLLETPTGHLTNVSTGTAD